MKLGVVFDLDGTLIDSLGDIALAANAVLEGEGGAPLPTADFAAFVGWGEQVFIDKLIEHVGLDAADRPRLLERFMASYSGVGHRVRLMPGAWEVLQEFRARKIPLGLCTNKPRRALEPVLRVSGLDPILTAQIAGDDLEVRKPHPAPLLRVISDLGVREALYVGDTPVDAETSRRAGIPFALYTEGIRTIPVEDIPHDRAFAHYSELPGIVEGFCAAQSASRG